MMTGRIPKLFSSLLLSLTLANAGSGPAPGLDPDPSQRFEYSEPQMGVPFKFILYAPDQARADRAAQAAYSRIAALNASLSNYETDSELSRLGYQSGRNGWTPVSHDLFRIIRHAQQMAQRSRGAFDLTIGPLAAAWRNARRTKAFPNRDQLDRLRRRVGWRFLQIDHARQKVQLSRKGMRLDPGGIAKGDALDQALKTLRNQGIQHALVAGAGDIAVAAPPPGRSAWRIELTAFSQPHAPPPPLVALTHRAIATSGDLFQFVELEGIRYSHIVDPRTGLGLTDRRLVTIIAPDGIVADSLATTLSIANEEQIDTILQLYPTTSARILFLRESGLEERFYQGFGHYIRSDWNP